MRISDWSSDVCSSDLGDPALDFTTQLLPTSDSFRIQNTMTYKMNRGESLATSFEYQARNIRLDGKFSNSTSTSDYDPLGKKGSAIGFMTPNESQGNLSKIGRGHLELQSLMTIPYAVFCYAINLNTN